MRVACDACLRRSHLVAHLAPRIAALLERPGRRAAGLLGLAEDDLIAVTAGQRRDEARAFLDAFDADAARARVDRVDVQAVCRHGVGYPARLRELTDPPSAVFFTGGEERLRSVYAQPCSAVVGTRRASPYGVEMAHALGRGLAAAGVTVVSGLALGIDAASHRGCLDAGGQAVAVLAGGADVPYPRGNHALYRRVRQQGIVLSELPPGQRAFRWSFPARNRIMAALGQMTVVVEAAEPSGSLITAEFAQDLGRPVGAVPGRATSRMAAGSNGLLRDGARVVTGTADVLDELLGVGAASLPVEPALRASRPEGELARDPGARAVLDALEAGAAVENIARRTGLGAREVRATLARLESGGHVRRGPLGSYERAAAP
jgi:DNA processing protein